MKRYIISITCIFLLMAYLLGCNQREVTVNDPFDITLTAVKIYEEIESDGTPSLRLKLTVDISNTTDYHLRDVTYELSLNDEAAFLIQTGALTRPSGDPIDIYSKEEAARSTDKGWGFTHGWNTVLTPAEDFVPSSISDYIKTITVTVHWNGGSQTKVLPITFTQEHFDIIENFK